MVAIRLVDGGKHIEISDIDNCNSASHTHTEVVIGSLTLCFIPPYLTLHLYRPRVAISAGSMSLKGGGGKKYGRRKRRMTAKGSISITERERKGHHVVVVVVLVGTKVANLAPTGFSVFAKPKGGGGGGIDGCVHICISAHFLQWET